MASTRLDSASDRIEKILADRNGILHQLEDDPVLINDELREPSKIDTDAILKREMGLSRELREYTALKTVPSLVLEFKTNLHLLEFENSFYSLQTLRKKLRDFSEILSQSYGLQRSVATYVDNMHLDLVNSLYSILNDGFWKIGSDFVSFQEKVAFGNDRVDIDYVDFMASMVSLYFPQGHLDPKSWIISDMILGTMQETVRAKLDFILKEYVKLSGVTNLIKSCIFAQSSEALLEDNNKTLKFRQSSKNGDEKFKETLSSFKNVLQFLTETVVSQDKKILAERLGPSISTELMKSIKANASIIFRPENTHLRDESLAINLILKDLSENSDIWSYNGSELERLFSNSDIPTNLQIDKILQDQLTELRAFFASKNWRILTTITAAEPTKGSSKKTTVRTKRFSSSSKRSIADDWTWEEEAEDNGWDEHVDLDLDEADEDSSSRKSKKETNSEAADDAWDEAWDVDIDDEEEQEKSCGSTDTTPERKVSQLPMKIIQLVDNFRGRCHEMDHAKLDKNHYRYKQSVLETLIMAMAERHFKEDWWQLFLDMKYLLQKDPSLSRFKELTHNYLELNLKSREAIVYKLVCGQLDELSENEMDPSWAITIDQLIPFIQNQILKPLARVGKIDSDRCLTSFLKFLYNDCITDNILQCKIISERNSENLSEFISLVYSKTEISGLNGHTDYRENREKFAIIGKFLPLHLKEIMEMFYNGDFYLFTTDELVQWIVLLFAETPLRRNAIDDIYEIRNANIDG